MSGGVLIFVAGGARLGVPLADVTRVTLQGRLTPIPFGHRALAGLMRGDDGTLVPVFDLQALGAGDDDARPRLHVDGATVAVLGTERGPVGLRLDRLLGTANRYDAHVARPAHGDDVDQEAVEDVVERHRVALSPAVRATLGGAGVPRDASASVGTAPFFFFSADAFVAAVSVVGEGGVRTSAGAPS